MLEPQIVKLLLLLDVVRVKSVVNGRHDSLRVLDLPRGEISLLVQLVGRFVVLLIGLELLL